jgi:hypothetical protein
MARYVEAATGKRVQALAGRRLLYACITHAGRCWGWVAAPLTLIFACSKLAEDCEKTLTCPGRTVAAAQPAGNAGDERPRNPDFIPDGLQGTRSDAGSADVGMSLNPATAGAPSNGPLGPVPPGLPPCSSDAECAEGTVCDEFFSVCVGCSANLDCAALEAPRCDPATRTCVGCESNSDCRGGAPQCGADGRCVECLENDQCDDPNAARCSGSVCSACADDADCSHFEPAAQSALCTGGRCVECRSSVDCPDPNRPVCNGGRCGGCNDEDDCARFEAAPACGEAGACVQCTENRHCTEPGAPRCQGTACAPCAEQSDCSHLPGTNVCDTTRDPRRCVECTRDNETACRSQSGAALVCDSLERRCTDFTPGSADLCGACVSDAHCRQAPLSRLCVEQVFEGVSVGHFCLPKADVAATFDPCNNRVFNVLEEDDLSIDDVQADLCHIANTTCPGLIDFQEAEFTGADCGSAGGGDAALCGADGLDDGVCASVGQVNQTFHCRIACVDGDDCPLGTFCRVGVCEQ